MWDFLPVQNLITMQRVAKLRELEQRMRDDNAAGYGLDADAALDEWVQLRDLIDRGPVA